MSLTYLQSLLPQWVKSFTLDGKFEIDNSMQFQIEWKKKFSALWEGSSIKLEGLTDLSVEVAKELAQWEGSSLDLNAHCTSIINSDINSLW